MIARVIYQIIFGILGLFPKFCARAIYAETYFTQALPFHTLGRTSSNSSGGAAASSALGSSGQSGQHGLADNKFMGEGQTFKGKLIGVLEVQEARGDRMCQVRRKTFQKIKLEFCIL